MAIATDDPENSVASILAILEDEADKLGAAFEHRRCRENHGWCDMVEIAIETAAQPFRLTLWHRERKDTGPYVGPFGKGDIDGLEQWVLDLRPENWDSVPRSAPYRWALFRNVYDYHLEALPYTGSMKA